MEMRGIRLLSFKIALIRLLPRYIMALLPVHSFAVFHPSKHSCWCQKVMRPEWSDIQIYTYGSFPYWFKMQNTYLISKTEPFDYMWKITLGKIFQPLLDSIKRANKDQTNSLVLTSHLLKLQKNRKKCNSQSYGKHRHDQEITSVWKTSCPSWPMHMLNSIKTHRGKETLWGHEDQTSHDGTPGLAFSPQLMAKVTQSSELSPETSLKAKILAVVSLLTHITVVEKAFWAEICTCCFMEMY